MRFRIFARASALGALIASLAVLAQPAFADASDFFGIWVNGSADNSGIVRVIVQPGDGAKITIHLFGRCGDKECDWGTQPAQAYASDPAANDVRSIAADFNTGYGHKRLTITTAVGHALRFDVQTDFSDGSARSNYATSGNVAYAGDWSSAPQVAAAPPPAAAPESGAPAPVASAAPPSPPSSGWFGGSSFVGLGPAVPQGYVPAAGEDCRPFDPAQVRVGVVNGDWQLASFSRHLLSFGSHQLAARVAAIVLGFYHFDEQCVVTDTKAIMVYWKRAGQLPRADMPGQDCVALNPANAKAERDDDDWHVAADGTTLLDFGDDKDGAERAVSVIHTYKLNRQCFFARPDSRAQYWLSQ
jgi:hypothetical protein